MRLALTDFNKNRVFYRNCIWLQPSQILKKIHKRKRKKISIYIARDVVKIRKPRVVSRVGIYLGMRSGDAMYRMRERALLPVI